MSTERWRFVALCCMLALSALVVVLGVLVLVQEGKK